MTGKVKVVPEATVVGRDELRHDHIAKFEVQYLTVMATPALHVTVSGDEAPTVTDPNETGFGVHERGGVIVPVLPMATTTLWTPR